MTGHRPFDDVTVRYSAVRNNAAGGAISLGGAILAGGKVTLLRARILASNAAEAGGVYAGDGLQADTNAAAGHDFG